MIKKLTLTNFRSHKLTEILFSEGVNVIVGRGQAGKTNIKRAIEWLFTNRPRGSKMHSFWCEKGDATSVKIETADGFIIRISKKEGDSVEYYLQDVDNHCANWAKVGGQVPDKILDALNLCELNMQHQLDPPYLITAGTGDISKAVNNAVDLDQADVWITEFNKRKKLTATALTVLSDQLQEANKQVVLYDRLPEASGPLVKAVDIRKNLAESTVKAQNISDKLADIYYSENKLEKLQSLPTAQKAIDSAANTQIYLAQALVKKTRLGKKLNAISSDQADIKRLAICGPLQRIQKKCDRILMMKNKAELRQVRCKKAIDAKIELKKQESLCKTAVEEYVNVLDEIGICPTCFTPVDNETINYVLDSLEEDK